MNFHLNQSNLTPVASLLCYLYVSKPSILIGIRSIDFQRFDLTEKKILKKKKYNFYFCFWFSFFLFYMIFKKIVKSKWVVRQFKSEFQKLVKSWDSILRICNNFAIKRLSPHCAPPPSLHFLCSKSSIFLTTYPPLNANIICEGSLIILEQNWQTQSQCPRS